MKRWVWGKPVGPPSQKRRETISKECPKVEAFLSDIYAACKKHGMALFPACDDREDARSLVVISTSMGGSHWKVTRAGELLANAEVDAETFPQGADL